MRSASTSYYQLFSVPRLPSEDLRRRKREQRQGSVASSLQIAEQQQWLGDPVWVTSEVWRVHRCALGGQADDCLGVQEVPGSQQCHLATCEVERYHHEHQQCGPEQRCGAPSC
jgi:hypothetical protein